MGHDTHDRPVSRRQVLKTTGLTAGAVLLGGLTTTSQVAARIGERVSYGTSTDVTNGGANEVKIVAQHDHEADEHRFELGTAEIPSGWTTFTFENPTDHTHFAYLARLPQATIDVAAENGEDLLDYYVTQVTEPFQATMDSLLGKNPRHDPELPEWYGDVRPSGGPGLTSPDATSQTTVELAPGEYIVECYVKNERNEFHSYHGMIDLITVTDDRSGEEPEASLDLGLSTDGIAADETVASGRQTVAVQFADQKLYDHLLGHDVHLIQFDDETTADDVNGWMNWMESDGLVSGESDPGTFIGGVETILTPGLLEGAEPETAYVHVDLAPGDYAWVAEVPSPAEKGLLKEFSVTGE